MAGTVKTNIVQLGDSATATQNLVVRTNVDGTFTIARGNAGATTQDILTIGADGSVAAPATNRIVSAFATAAQTIPQNTPVKLVFGGVEVDIGNSFSNSRFQPNVSGWYVVGGGFQVVNSLTTVILWLYKNGADYKHLAYCGNSGGAFGSGMVYLNGTTDYVELYGSQGATSQATDWSAAGVYFQARLAAKV
jgi:hypothetical protein